MYHFTKGFTIIITRRNRSTTYVDVAHCYTLSSMVCHSVTVVRPAKMAEQTEMRFGTRVGPRNHILDGGAYPPMGKGNFKGEKGWRIVK